MREAFREKSYLFAKHLSTTITFDFGNVANNAAFLLPGALCLTFSFSYPNQ